jgi:ubiquitin-protein ligase
MAEDIRNRRLSTELENINKIDKNKFGIERRQNILEDGIVLNVTFNLKHHPYNPKLLTDRSELSLVKESEDDEEQEEDKEAESEFSDDEPVDECEDKEYEFDLIVPKKFPFVFPEVRARWDFSIPSLMDERDLLEDLLGKTWHPFIILKDIIERLPQYVYKIKKRQKENTLYYKWEPKFVLNSIYDLTNFKENNDVCKAFACKMIDDEEMVVSRKKKKTEEIKRLQRDAQEHRDVHPEGNMDWIDRVDDERFNKNIVIVSDNAFLLFERPPFEEKESNDTQIEGYPIDQLKFSMGKLILWGTITSIEQLKRNMEFKDNISIVWSRPVKNEDEFDFSEDPNEDLEEDAKDEEEPLEKVYETRLQFPESDDFMMVVLDKMNKIEQNTNQLKKKKILSMEVTWHSVKHKNIKSLEHEIQVFEKEFDEKQTKELAQDLMELYRKAVEYYSAINDDKYKAIMAKDRQLIAFLAQE